MATQRAGMNEQSTTSTSPQACPTVKTDHEDLWHTLIVWDDLEHWRQDNQWIRGSYRKTANSYLRSFASIFQIHNETVNIWSHMVPAILSLPMAYFLHSALGSRYERASKSDIVAFGFFFAGSALCMGMSAMYVSYLCMLGQH
jgi:adiponectin receptor